MGSRIATEPAPLIERGCAPVYFVNGIAKITTLSGGNLLFTFYRIEDGHREVEIKLVCSRDDLATMIRQSSLAMAGGAVADEEAPVAVM